MEPMDEQQARQRLLEGGYFVALGVPPGVEFGIDLKSYETGNRFKGVKMIPPGLHFVHCGTGEGEKQGLFFRAAAGSVAVAQWDPEAEDLVDAQRCLPEGALRALRESVLRLEMDDSLGPYPLEQRAPWLNLTNCITDSVLERCGVPIGAKVLAGSSAAEGEPGGAVGAADSCTSGGGGGGAGMEIVPRFPHVGRVAQFCQLPARSATNSLLDGAGGCSGAPNDPQHLTKINMDRSEALRGLIASSFRGAWAELLGELQLSFVLFVSLASLRGFRHWQALSVLLCRCGDALATDPALFTAFIRMLHAHLKLVPEDFFNVELSKDNFLVPCLSALIQNVLPDKSLDPTLADAGKRLLKFLRLRFGLFTANGGHPSPPRLSSPPLPAPPPLQPLQQQQQQTTALQQATPGTEAPRQADGDLRGEDMGGFGDGAGRVGGFGAVVEGVGGFGAGAPVPERARARVGGPMGGPDSGGGEEDGLSLMQLELSEEDLPAVVPYEEKQRLGALVTTTPSRSCQMLRVLGGAALGGADSRSAVQHQHLPVPGAPSEAEEVPEVGPTGREGHAKPAASSAERSGGRASARPVNLSAPSVEHSRRWRDIDRLLSASMPSLSNGTLNPAMKEALASPSTLSSAAAATASETDASTSSAVSAPPLAETMTTPAPAAAVAAAAAAGGYAAAAAKRYPLLFASIGEKEDVMMTAARLMAYEGENPAGGDGGGEACAGAAAEAVAFLMEVEGREDGGASAWQLTAGGRRLSR